MSSEYRVITEQQEKQFLECGYVAMRGCFPRKAAAKWTANLWKRLGYDPRDRSTWGSCYTRLAPQKTVDLRSLAPLAWDAICDLVGGEEQIAHIDGCDDGFIVNLCQDCDDPWRPPSPQHAGWHKDGDSFRHFLDSPEQGLLTLVLWSDVIPHGGGTYIATDSVGPVARYLAEKPEGVLPMEFDIGSLIGQCGRFVEATGEPGDVYLLHPFLLHAVGQNTRCSCRVISNPSVRLRNPMKFDGPRRHASLVERAVLRGLGVKSFAFVRRGPREAVLPERVRRAYTAVGEIFGLADLRAALDALGESVDMGVQAWMRGEVNLLGQRGCRWLLQRRRSPIDIREAVDEFGAGIGELVAAMPGVLFGRELWRVGERFMEMRRANVPGGLAVRIAGLRCAAVGLDLVEVAERLGCGVRDVAETYFVLGDRLGVDRLVERVAEAPGIGRGGASPAMVEMIQELHVAVTEEVMRTVGEAEGGEDRVRRWEGGWAVPAEEARRGMSVLVEADAFDLDRLSEGLSTVRQVVSHSHNREPTGEKGFGE